MHFDRYTRLRISGTDVLNISSRISSWAIPHDGNARERRRVLGMPRTWVAEQLTEDADMTGDADFRVQARWTPERTSFLARLVHRDSEDARIFWHIAFRVTDNTDGWSLVESGVARSAPSGIYLAPRAYAPGVIGDFLREPGAIRVEERALTLPTLQISERRDVVAFVDDLLLRPGRETPLVVIAADLGGPKSSHVDEQTIARKLKGLCVVAVLHGPDVAAAYREAVQARDLGRELACFNGGIHTYGPSATIRTDHRLWLGRSLVALPERERSELVGETLARRVALSQLPQGFFSLIEDHDRAARAGRAARASAPAPSRTSGDSISSELKAALALMEEANDRAQQLEAELRTAMEKRDALDYEKQQVEIDLDVERQNREYLQGVLDERRREDFSAALPDDVRVAIRDVARKRFPAPPAALRFIEAVFPDRVVVLAEAHESAEEAAAFRNPRDAFELLVRLATDYWEKLTSAPATARMVFTEKEFATAGSEQERNSGACVADRTRRYGGREIVMWPHLKAGGNGGPDKCLRIHFEWIADERKIVIGHCGRHLKEA